MRSQKIFRYLWRVNAVLILLAAGAVSFGVGALLVEEFGRRTARGREADAGIPIAAADHLASLSAGDLTILYERDRRLVLATFDPASLGKHAEQVIDVPQPK